MRFYRGCLPAETFSSLDYSSIQKCCRVFLVFESILVKYSKYLGVLQNI